MALRNLFVSSLFPFPAAPGWYEAVISCPVHSLPTRAVSCSLQKRLPLSGICLVPGPYVNQQSRCLQTSAATFVRLSPCLHVRNPIRINRSEEPDDLADGEIPVIRVPKRMNNLLQKALSKRETARAESMRNSWDRSSPLVIKAKNPEFNYRAGAPPIPQKGFKVRTGGERHQTRFLSVKLASQGWSKPKAVGDWFRICAHPSGIHPSMKDSLLDSVPGFEKFDLTPNMMEAIKEMKLGMCSTIQNKAIPLILQGESVSIAAETGSGKTLTYLIPLINRLMLESPPAEEDPTIAPVGNSPKIVVLIPNRELAKQVYDVAMHLVKHSPNPINVVNIVGGDRFGRRRRQHELVDLLVATPGVMLTLVERNIYTLGQVQTMVLDECDTLLDDSFISLTRSFLTQLNFTKPTAMPDTAADEEASLTPPTLSTAQLILSGATLPKNMNETLKDIVPASLLQPVHSTYLHKVQPHVQQTFLRVKEPDKAGVVMKLIHEDRRKEKATLIFCNHGETAYWLGKCLQENNLPADIIHGDLRQSERRGRYDQFKNGVVPTLVCTDITSRGLDTTFVEHVINYDFPRVVSDYIHRCGRVGRLGGTGRGAVTSLVAHKWEIPTVQAIEEAVRHAARLPDVNANITRMINQQYGVDPLVTNPAFQEMPEEEDQSGIKVEPQW